MSCNSGCNSDCCSSGMGKFCVGMAMGLVAGMAVGITMCPTRREMKKMANNAAQHMTDMVEHFSEAMGM